MAAAIFSPPTEKDPRSASPKPRDALNVDQADVAHAALNVAEISAVDPGTLRELLLGQFQLFTPAFDRKSKALADVRLGPLFHCVHASRV
jgi:hypothetical protein